MPSGFSAAATGGSPPTPRSPPPWRRKKGEKKNEFGMPDTIVDEELGASGGETSAAAVRKGAHASGVQRCSAFAPAVCPRASGRRGPPSRTAPAAVTRGTAAELARRHRRRRCARTAAVRGHRCRQRHFSSLHRSSSSSSSLTALAVSPRALCRHRNCHRHRCCRFGQFAGLAVQALVPVLWRTRTSVALDRV